MQLKVVETTQEDAVALSHKAIAALGLAEGATVAVTYDDTAQQLRVTSLPETIDEEFAAQLNEFIEQYRPALQTLAND